MTSTESIRDRLVQRLLRRDVDVAQTQRFLHEIDESADLTIQERLVERLMMRQISAGQLRQVISSLERLAAATAVTRSSIRDQSDTHLPETVVDETGSECASSQLGAVCVAIKEDSGGFLSVNDDDAADENVDCLDDMPIEDVWREYHKTGSEELRNFLMELYLHLVRSTAERMHMRLPGEVDVEDLMSAGLFGLMDAIDAFDVDRGVKFETYCTQRIRGAIFDELRAMDWVPRLVRSRTAKIDRVRKGFEMQFGRRPTEQELCDRLAVSHSEFDKLSKDSKPVNIVSLNRKWFETDSNQDIREIDVLQDNKQEDPLSELQKKDLKLLITKGLSRAERLIVILYYYEEMTMKEIGTSLDLSESRISQMHSSILARLQAQMQYREKEF